MVKANQAGIPVKRPVFAKRANRTNQCTQTKIFNSPQMFFFWYWPPLVVKLPKISIERQINPYRTRGLGKLPYQRVGQKCPPPMQFFLINTITVNSFWRGGSGKFRVFSTFLFSFYFLLNKHTTVGFLPFTGGVIGIRGVIGIPRVIGFSMILKSSIKGESHDFYMKI